MMTTTSEADKGGDEIMSCNLILEWEDPNKNSMQKESHRAESKQSRAALNHVVQSTLGNRSTSTALQSKNMPTSAKRRKSDAHKVTQEGQRILQDQQGLACFEVTSVLVSLFVTKCAHLSLLAERTAIAFPLHRHSSPGAENGYLLYQLRAVT